MIWRSEGQEQYLTLNIPHLRFFRYLMRDVRDRLSISHNNLQESFLKEQKPPRDGHWVSICPSPLLVHEFLAHLCSLRCQVP